MDWQGNEEPSMDSKLYRAMTALLWLALPLTAFQFWTVWNRLPARTASHFGVAGQPNGWMSREALLIFSLVLVAILLATFTWVLTRIRKPDPLAWSLLAMFYVAIAVLLSVNSSVLNYNLYSRPLNIVPQMILVVVAALVVIAIALGTKRGALLPKSAGTLEVEEVHKSSFLALAFAAITVVELGVAAMIPLRALQLVMIVPSLLLAAAAALAWSGFRYRFSDNGIEISTLGFRLRSVPLQNIKAYAIAPWSPIGGYGVRGIGEKRAYVWGNTGVRIMLSDGEVFLGHAEPERIVNDLNAIRQTQKARERT
ncbi:MAG: DUF1648 domain-containing protein [Terriglobales bacterium]